MTRLFAWLFVCLAVVSGAQASPWSATCIQSIGAGQTITGQLTTSDCAFYETDPAVLYRVDVYAFSGTAGQQIAIAMNSSAVDAFVQLYNVNEVSAAPLAHDDDSGGGLNARLPTTGYFTLPATGTYYIWAHTALPNQTGSYTITVSVASGTPPGRVTVYEFYHPVFNHYFITAYAEEAASLAAGNLPPWTPTGQTFLVWNGPGEGIVNVCRFFSTSFAPRSSHFYSGNAAECPGLAARGAWTLEAQNAFYMMTTASGACPSGTIPLYRLYNNGMSGAPNHRYTTSAAVRSQMVGAGWVPEGNGPDGVFACVLASGSEPVSDFRAEVTGYADTILGLVNGNIVDADQLTIILQSALGALIDPRSTTCPVATSNPPLAGLNSLPSSLTINVSYGAGCNVATGSTQTNISGSLVINGTNLALTDSSLAGTLGITFNNVKIDNALVANGAVQATLNLTVNASTGAISGPVTVTLSSLQLPNFGVSGTVTINLNTTGTTTIATNLTTTPNNVAIRLNLLASPRSDGALVVNSTGTNTVGAYAVQFTNVVLDSSVCTNGATSGTVSFTKGGQTATLTFGAGCRYSYSGP